MTTDEQSQASSSQREAASGAAMDRIVRRSVWPKRIGAVALVASALGAYLLVGGALKSGERSLQVSGDRITTAIVKTGKFDDFIQIRGRFIPLRTIFIDTMQLEDGEADCLDDSFSMPFFLDFAGPTP